MSVHRLDSFTFFSINISKRLIVNILNCVGCTWRTGHSRRWINNRTEGGDAAD